MQSHMICDKNESHLECFVNKLCLCAVGFFVEILTRKHEKDLQLTWPQALKYDTVFTN